MYSFAYGETVPKQGDEYRHVSEYRLTEDTSGKQNNWERESMC